MTAAWLPQHCRARSSCAGARMIVAALLMTLTAVETSVSYPVRICSTRWLHRKPSGHEAPIATRMKLPSNYKTGVRGWTNGTKVSAHEHLRSSLLAAVAASTPALEQLPVPE